MNKKIVIKKDEEIILPIIWTGDESELVYDVVLSQRGARLKLFGLLVGKKSQSLDLRINVTHAAPDTQSEIILKGVLLDKASINFEGLVNIEKGAKGTKAWEGCNILLLSDSSRGRAIPSLQIKENDIKAGHAATVGKVNEIEMFYLTSRGLTPMQAKRLIVEGFLKSIIDRFPADLKISSEKQVKKFVS